MVPGQPAARAPALHARPAYRQSPSSSDGSNVLHRVSTLAVAACPDDDRRPEGESGAAHLLRRGSRAISRLANFDAPPGIVAFHVDAFAFAHPEVLSLLFHFANSSRAAAFGGRARMALSVLLEMLGSTLLAPNLAFLQSRFVIGTLMGKKAIAE